jgi:hypothetical protein
MTRLGCTDLSIAIPDATKPDPESALEIQRPREPVGRVTPLRG